MTDVAHTDVADGQSVLLAVSNAMVKMYKEQFGRGPTKARTHYAGPDTLICTLQDSLTPVERNLVLMDEHRRLRDTRMFFQYAKEGEFREAVERITGRTVWAFVSGIDTRQDVSIEAFYLEPQSNGDAVS
ncbi:MAG: hypothetical protein QOC77_3267 [Thermoleophilaceae bacterium]|jgi:uncharacterized protein YbcI|nr:hypothetical protein [Thermoleophilaceae bacterium]MEA2471631.1 hypothetical protein [Thermoleophilaceae bacterium]